MQPRDSIDRAQPVHCIYHEYFLTTENYPLYNGISMHQYPPTLYSPLRPMSSLRSLIDSAIFHSALFFMSIASPGGYNYNTLLVAACLETRPLTFISTRLFSIAAHCKTARAMNACIKPRFFSEVVHHPIQCIKKSIK